ncbi:hypothetical protein IU469_30050 [Nocardia puris]|uniref:Uncharacterized protein n=1 Tax=Nocardia puris TaxID=208602 RepID=A0A366D5L0_9NOCA|nr:hypothetical protein [Nocardia puris]MBF6215519.1 hypothetical protein [Nocardia puris]MBF6369923.1 hypothetical protein [Nocardia puris]RBO85317.1 hypothetical protein DFR74_115165 [Nocardia puris]
MTPREDAGRLTRWQARLLEQIQTRAAEFRRRADRGPGEVPLTAHTDADIALVRWHAGLADLRAERRELEEHAYVAGVPLPLIDLARDLGHAGIAWEDGRLARAMNPSRLAPLAEQQREAIAIQVYGMQRAALLTLMVDGRHAAEPDLTRADEWLMGAEERMWRNMQARWRLAEGIGAVAELTEIEHTQLWDGSAARWARHVEALRTGRSELDLGIEYTSAARASVEQAADRALALFGLRAEQAGRAGSWADAPRLLLADAESALLAASQHPSGDPWRTDLALQAFAAPGPDRQWREWLTGPDIDPTVTTPGPDTPHGGPEL